MKVKKQSITIFGPGKVGSALNRALSKAGYRVVSMFASDEFPQALNELGELILIATPDSVIESLALKISKSFSDFEGKIFVHCSGTQSSDILGSLKDKKAAIGSFHPMKSITSKQNSFSGTWFDIEGDQKCLAVLSKVAEDLDAKTIEVDKDTKALLHASAVMVSNYYLALLQSASEIAQLSGVDKDSALEILLPLSYSVLENVKENGIEHSLTGPIARGDVSTVEKHVKLLKKQPELLNLYKNLGVFTLNLASLDRGTYSALKSIFEENK